MPVDWWILQKSVTVCKCRWEQNSHWSSAARLTELSNELFVFSTGFWSRVVVLFISSREIKRGWQRAEPRSHLCWTAGIVHPSTFPALLASTATLNTGQLAPNLVCTSQECNCFTVYPLSKAEMQQPKLFLLKNVPCQWPLSGPGCYQYNAWCLLFSASK